MFQASQIRASLSSVLQNQGFLTEHLKFSSSVYLRLRFLCAVGPLQFAAGTLNNHNSFLTAVLV